MLTAMGGHGDKGSWWARLDLNQRPPACETGALPLSYAPGIRIRPLHRPSEFERIDGRPNRVKQGKRAGNPLKSVIFRDLERRRGVWHGSPVRSVAAQTEMGLRWLKTS